MSGEAGALSRRAFALLAQRSYREAAELFAQALRERPGDAHVWSGLSAALIGVRDYRRGQRAAQRAIELDPALAHAHANLGLALKYQRRFDDAVAAHEQAVRLAPRAARPLAQLGLALVPAGRLAEAEIRLREALALDPALAMASRNLAVLLVKRERQAEALALLNALNEKEGQEQPVTVRLLARVREDLRMRDAVRQSFTESSPMPLVAAADATAAARLAIDADRLVRLQRLAVQARTIATQDAAAPAPATPHWWPRVEAYFNLHLGDEPADLLASIAVREPSTPELADLFAAADAVAARIAFPLGSGADPAGREARIRWYHALLARHHPDWLPGRFKLLETIVTHNPTVAHTPPEAVAGTLRAAFDGPIASLAPGLARAALAMVAIGHIHPFTEANGRIARLLASGECEAAGLGPLVVPASLRIELQGALVAVAGGAPLSKVTEVLGRALAFTRALIERIGRDATAAAGAGQAEGVLAPQAGAACAGAPGRDDAAT